MAKAIRICSAVGCGKPAKKRGMCNPHYNVWYRENVRVSDDRVCAVPGCGRRLHAHGYCDRHAYHFKAHGDPLGGRCGASPGAPKRWIEEHANYQGDDCIRWPFEVSKYGYGVVKQDGKKRLASRVMCEAAHGPAPSQEHEAAHSCGNGHLACMNQNHLSWKTRLGNVADAIAHGTWNHGETVPSHKLTESEVKEIRRLAATESYPDLAARFGVNRSAISRIVARKRWGWLD